MRYHPIIQVNGNRKNMYSKWLFIKVIMHGWLRWCLLSQNYGQIIKLIINMWQKNEEEEETKQT